LLGGRAREEHQAEHGAQHDGEYTASAHEYCSLRSPYDFGDPAEFIAISPPGLEATGAAGVR